MLRLRKPNPDTVQHFLESQRELDFTYEAVGATAGELPAGYIVDHTRARLGEGKQVYSAAKSALACWQQFHMSWLHVSPADTPVRRGEVVAIIARSLGLWWLNACRIVYLIEETPGHQTFGFAYGTLPDHAGTGEERFLIEMDDEENVWYDILAFSRPNHALARIGYPYMRRVQRQFGRLSTEAMQQAVQSRRPNAAVD